MTEIYFCTDVESDGPIPGPHSLLSFASVAMDRRGQTLATFSANLELLDGASPHPRTAAFWRDNAAAYEATRTETEAPAVAMARYQRWIEEVCAADKARAVFVAFPAGYDFLFVYWYLMRFVGASPFSHSALDMKTFAAALTGAPYRSVNKRFLKARWPTKKAHSHVALDDAREQAEIFAQMLSEVPTAR